MNCPCRNENEFDLLLDHAAGRLDPSRAALLQSHMSDCPECAAFAEVSLALDGFAAPPLSTGFNRAVWQKIDTPEPWYAGLVRGLREGAWKPVFPLAAAAVLVAAGFAFDHHTAPATRHVTLAEAEQAQITLEDLQLLQNLNASAAEVAEPIL
jgi:anti-sigma factor RsiW